MRKDFRKKKIQEGAMRRLNAHARCLFRTSGRPVSRGLSAEHSECHGRTAEVVVERWELTENDTDTGSVIVLR